MARLNSALERSAARKASYRESGEEDGLSSPEPSRKKMKTETSGAAYRSGSSDNESDPEQHDPSHATSGNSRVRINQVIQDLVKAGKDTLVFCDTTPLKTEPQVCPPALDLSLIKLSTAELLFLEDSVLYGYLTSNDFLPCVAQWKKECIDNLRLRSLLLAALPDDEYPFVKTATYLAQKAPKYVSIIEENRTLNHPHAEIMLICLKYVWRLKRCTMAQFMHFLREAQYPHLEDFIYMFCARALLTVYADIRLHGADGFFAIMLDSRFAEPMTLEARRAWDKLLILPSSSSGADTAASVNTIQAASIAYAKSTGFKSNATPLSEEETQQLHFKVEMECWKLKNAFVEAVGESPELKMVVPAEVGRTEWSKARKREKKAGQTPRFKRELNSFCDSDCTPKTDTHSRACSRKLIAAQDEWQEAKGYDVEADVPDQEPAKADFTFQQKQSTLIPPEQVISRFNQRDVVEPFSDEEKFVALTRFRMALNLRKGDMVDGAFEWTMISEVLAGRSVADCVRFYYQHKHIIFMKLGKRPNSEQPLLSTGEPEWSPHLSAAQRRRVGNIIDIDRFLEHMATLEAGNTDLRIRNEILEAAAVRMRSDGDYHRQRGDRHLKSCNQKDKEIERLMNQPKAAQRQKHGDMEAMQKQFKAVQLEKDEEIERLKKQLAESQAYGEGRNRLAEWHDRCAEENLARAERLEEDLKEVKGELKGAKERLGRFGTGHDFLKNITYTRTPKQWRGEM